MRFKQKILDYIKESDEINPDWIVWLDADEIMDKKGTDSIKMMLNNIEPDINSIDVHEVNLWRSNSWKRLDSLFDAGYFKRFWRYKDGLTMLKVNYLHATPYPINLTGKAIVAPFEVIHFGFASDKAIIRKIRVYRAFGRAKDIYNRYIDEKVLASLVEYSLDNYPEHARPEVADSRPIPYDRETWRNKIGTDII